MIPDGIWQDQIAITFAKDAEKRIKETRGRE